MIVDSCFGQSRVLYLRYVAQVQPVEIAHYAEVPLALLIYFHLNSILVVFLSILITHYFNVRREFKVGVEKVNFK